MLSLFAVITGGVSRDPVDHTLVNVNWRDWALTAAAELEGEVDLTGGFAFTSSDVIQAFPTEILLQMLTTRIDPEKSIDVNMTLGIRLPDVKEEFALEIRRGVVQLHQRLPEKTDVVLVADRGCLNRMLVGDIHITGKMSNAIAQGAPKAMVAMMGAIESGDIELESGSESDLQKFFSYFDEPVDVGAINLIVREVADLRPQKEIQVKREMEWWMVAAAVLLAVVATPAFGQQEAGDEVPALSYQEDIDYDHDSDVDEGDLISLPFQNNMNFDVGPALVFPTATDDVLGTDKWSLGPSVVALTMPGQWVIGALVSNVWSVAGDDERSDVNTFLGQYFINYNYPSRWYLTSAPIITANWEADGGEKWTVPFGGGIGKVFAIGRQPINVNSQVFYNVEKPTNGADWQWRFQI